MGYQKHTWVAPEGEHLNRFNKLNETESSVDLVQNPELTNTPTPFSAEWMNELEDGVEDANIVATTASESAEAAVASAEAAVASAEAAVASAEAAVASAEAVSGQDRVELFNILNNHSEEMDGRGRNVLSVLGVQTIAEASYEMQELCNGSADANFSYLRKGDYIDGISLAGIPAEKDGDAGQAYNDTYKNNRIVISGFNTYKGFGDTETTKNHILFTFRNIPLRKKMNDSNTNSGGYPASDLRVFLEGANGDGTGAKSGITTAAFLNKLKEQLGGNYLITIRKYHHNKGSGAWKSYTLWLPTELELFGISGYGEESVYGPTDRGGYFTNVHFDIYRSGEYRIKRYGGVRTSHWTSTPIAAISYGFASCYYYGRCDINDAYSVMGCAPAFCFGDNRNV